MGKIKCFLGFHKGPLIMKEKTKEVDTESGVFLTRNVYHCDVCNKTYHKRTDNLVGISNDKQWTWMATDFYF
jgi:hypothetical protein